MDESIPLKIWIIATLFGGVGAAIVNWLFEVGKGIIAKRRIVRSLKRELRFNIAQVKGTIEKVKELKEEYIQFDRQNLFHHFFKFTFSPVMYRGLINAGRLYEFLDDEQILKFEHFTFGYSEGAQKILNDFAIEVQAGKYPKVEAANKVDFFLLKYRELVADLENILIHI